MRFKLDCINWQTNKLETWEYDNIDNIVIDSCGEEVNKISNPRNSHIISFTSKNNNNKLSKSPRQLKISLGTNCNFDCSYCFQKGIRENKRSYSAHKNDIVPFVQKLRELQIEPNQIKFWGGEPLVYWKVLKPLIIELRKYYPLTRMDFITNGSLLDNDKVDFLIDNKIVVMISHDGYSNTDRTNDILEEKKELIDRLYKNKLLLFIPCIHKGNCNTTRINEFFKHRYPNRKKINTLNNVARCEDSNDLNQILSVKMSDKEYNELEISNFFLSLKDNNNVSGIGKQFEKRLLNQFDSYNIIGECDTAVGNIWTVNLRGDIFICHNRVDSEHCIGNLNDFDKVRIRNLYHWSERPNCKNCPMLGMCQAGCAGNKPKAHTLSCSNKYHYYLGIFKGVFLKLYNISILKIEKDNAQ